MPQIACSDIKLGDFVIIQGRTCQVLRISTNVGLPRYLGVDPITKQLHEGSPPSKDDLTMPDPGFKSWRVLDLTDGYATCMTDTGDVKQGLAVVDQSNLWTRLRKEFESGTKGVLAQILNDSGREVIVDMKTQ